MARKLKLGRNDPCPCGSGKKYKNCCGLLSDITPSFDDPFVHYSQMLVSVKLKLDRYFEAEVKKHRQQIRSRFTRFSVNKDLRPEHESVFSDWMWLDFQDNTGISMAADYLEENQDYMEIPLRECLKALDNSYLSVYQITGSDGVKLNVNDTFLDTSYQVIIKEALTLKQEDPEMLLLARMVQLQDVNLFSGMVLMLENDARQKEFIKEHLAYIKDLYQDEVIDVLKNYGELLYGIFDHAGHKILVNLNDMRIAPLDEDEQKILLDELESSQEYLLQHETEGLSWFKPVEKAAGYSRMIIGQNLVLSCSDVLEDVMRQSGFLNSVLPNKCLQVFNSLMLQAPPDMEYNWLWFTVLKDRECEKWLNTPHRELDGQTPNDILVEEGGKEKIIAMLDEFINSISINEEKELLEYMKKRIIQAETE